MIRMIKGMHRKITKPLLARILSLWGNASLSIKAVVLLVVFMVTVFSGLGYLSVRTTENITEQALIERAVLANATANHLDSLLTHFDELMRATSRELSESEDHLKDDGECLAPFYSQVSMYLLRLTVLDMDGMVIRSCPDAGDPSIYDELDFEALRSMSDEKVPISLIEGYELPLAAYELQTETGEEVGWMIGTMDLAAGGFDVFGPAQALGISGHVEIIDEWGIILRSTEPEHTFTDGDHDGIMAQMIVEGEARTATCHGCHDPYSGEMRVNEVMAFAPLTQVTWGVAVHQLESEVYAASAKARSILRILACGSGGMVVVLGMLIYQSVSKPLDHLARLADEYASGNLSRGNGLNRGDEIGRVAHALDVMRRQIKGRIELIESKNVELDGKATAAAVDLESTRGELKQASRAIQAVMDGLDDHILVIGSDKRIRMANQSARRAWRRSTQVIGLPCWEVAHYGSPCLSTGCGCPVDTVFKTGTPSTSLHAHTDEPTPNRYLRFSAFPMFDDDGNVEQVIEQISDVTAEYRQRTQRKMLLKKIISAQEEERQRLGRELHDDTGQALTAIIVHCAALAERAKTDSPELETGLLDLRSQTVLSLQSLRTMIHDLRPEVLDELGLAQAIRSLAKERLSNAGIMTDVKLSGLEDRLDSETEITIFRVVQEAINNVVRHAHASSVSISVARRGRWIELTVHDDGIGFHPRMTRRDFSRLHWGLQFMHERVELLGGSLTISSVPSQGTTISGRIPVEL